MLVLVENSWFELGVFLKFSFFLFLKLLNAFLGDGEQGARSHSCFFPGKSLSPV